MWREACPTDSSKEEHGGDSTSSGASAGQASHGREFSRAILRGPRARVLGSWALGLDDRARGALAAFPRSPRAVQRRPRQTNQPSLPRPRSPGGRKGRGRMSDQTVEQAFERQKNGTNGHASVAQTHTAAILSRVPVAPPPAGSTPVAASPPAVRKATQPAARPSRLR